MNAGNAGRGGRREPWERLERLLDPRLGRVPYRPQTSFPGRGGFERSTGWVMPPIEPASASSPSENPDRRPPHQRGPASPIGKYLVIGVVALTVGATVWIVLDALPHAFDVDPGRAARRSGQPAATAEIQPR